MALLIACYGIAAQKMSSKHTLDKSANIVQPFKYVEQMPEFNGDINSWIHAHLIFPEDVKDFGGRIVVEFTIMEDGKVADATILRSSNVPASDAEALRLVYAMPFWKPGRNNGMPVKVRLALPITVCLQ